MSPDAAAIRDLVSTWMKASAAGDLQTANCTEPHDGRCDVHGFGARAVGKEAFAAMSQGMSNVRVEGASDIRELRVLGDWAYLRNYLDIIVTPPGGAAVRRAGWTLTILRKEGGQWKIARDANLLTVT